MSAMHVNAFVPFRTVRILPSASMATMVAPLATIGGAALMALAMICASVIGAGASAARTPDVKAIDRMPTVINPAVSSLHIKCLLDLKKNRRHVRWDGPPPHRA
jgi:hypothetical protein